MEIGVLQHPADQVCEGIITQVGSHTRRADIGAAVRRRDDGTAVVAPIEPGVLEVSRKALCAPLKPAPADGATFSPGPRLLPVEFFAQFAVQQRPDLSLLEARPDIV